MISKKVCHVVPSYFPKKGTTSVGDWPFSGSHAQGGGRLERRESSVLSPYILHGCHNSANLVLKQVRFSCKLSCGKVDCNNKVT